MNPKEAINCIAELRAYVKRQRAMGTAGCKHNQDTAEYLDQIDRLSRFALGQVAAGYRKV